MVYNMAGAAMWSVHSLYRLITVSGIVELSFAEV